MDREFYEYCLKVLEVPRDIPKETLSFSEKKSIKLCREMAMNYSVNLDEYRGVYDKDKWQKVLQLYFTKYNY